jgi:sulfate permease, SulP family
MLVALPSAIAFGLVIYAPLGPAWVAKGAIAGILGTVAMGLVAPLLGGTPRLISAPCAPAAAVMAALAAELVAGGGPGGRAPLDPAVAVTLMALVGLLSGSLQLFFGAARGGKLIKFVPYPVVAGYLGGVGVTIFLGQLPRLLGLAKGVQLLNGLVSPGGWRLQAIAVGGVTIAVMVLAPRLIRGVPAPILGLAGGALTYFGLALSSPAMLTLTGNSLVIGKLGDGGLRLADLADRWRAVGSIGSSDLQLVLVPALTLAVLLSIDTLKTCIVVDALTRSRHDSNRELLGQGLGNLASALCGGVPGSGVMGATLVNVSSGGKTRVSGVLEGTFAAAAFLLLGPLVAWVPVAALAGILLVVAVRMVDRNVFHLLKHKSTVLDFAVVLAVVVTSVVVSLIAAAGVGLGLAIMLFLREQVRSSVVRRKTYGNRMFSKKRRLPEEVAVLERDGGQTAVYELQGSLFFGTTDQLFTDLEADIRTRSTVILDLRRVQSVDFTATHLLDQIEARLAERGGTLVFSELPPNLPTGQDLAVYFDQVGLVRPTRRVKVFGELDDALAWAEDRILEAAGLERAADETALELHEIDLFKKIDDETLAALATCTVERSYEPGQKVFVRGEGGDEIFLIRRGLVRVMLHLSDGRQHHIATFGRGDFFGDMAFLAPGQRSAEAEASTAVDLYSISRARFDEVSSVHPVLEQKVFRRLARALAVRLRQTDAELRSLEES